MRQDQSNVRNRPFSFKSPIILPCFSLCTLKKVLKYFALQFVCRTKDSAFKLCRLHSGACGARKSNSRSDRVSVAHAYFDSCFLASCEALFFRATAHKLRISRG